MDIDLFLEILQIDSTSGSERPLADFLCQRLKGYGCDIEAIPSDAKPDEPVNVFFKWGQPRVVFCTHLDTVPPYLPPTVERTYDSRVHAIHGRGSCDAKGQIFSMLQACRRLSQAGETGFGLLLLYGEETGSFGAKKMAGYPGAEFVVVGEPTDNRMATASKGTKAFEVEIKGVAAHSGYPANGVSAIENFVDFMQRLRAAKWPEDKILGDTTYNVGRLESPNPQNILSPSLTCRVYFRTTFASDAKVGKMMESMQNEWIKINPLGGDTPMHYLTLPGFDTCTVAFGSDAPQLKNFKNKILCGPGSILVAHTDKEFIDCIELQQAIDNYVAIFQALKTTED